MKINNTQNTQITALAVNIDERGAKQGLGRRLLGQQMAFQFWISIALGQTQTYVCCACASCPAIKRFEVVNKGRSPFKKTVKKGDIVPFWRPPPLNGSKGDICCLITDKSA